MKEIFNSLTEHDEQSGVLKALLSEPDLEKLRQNPFHITQSNIQVKLNNFLLLSIIFIYCDITLLIKAQEFKIFCVLILTFVGYKRK